MSQPTNKSILSFDYKSFDTFADKIAFLNDVAWFCDFKDRDDPWCLLNIPGHLLALLIYGSMNDEYQLQDVHTFRHTKYGMFLLTYNNKSYFITEKELLQTWEKLAVSYITEFKHYFNCDTESAIKRFKRLLYVKEQSGDLVFGLPNIQ